MAKKSSKNENTEANSFKPAPEMASRRLDQIRFTLEDLKLDALVVTSLANIRYITNFSGSAAILFITNDALHFITDDRYDTQIKSELYELPNLKTYITRDVWGLVNSENILDDIDTLGFEADVMPYSEAVDIRNKIRPVKFKPAAGEIERFMRPKAPEELESIKKACSIAEEVYEKIIGMVKPGMTEHELASEISYQARLLGSEGEAFDIIAVSGERSALVHGQPSDKVIKKGDIILLDFGCIVNGFRSDITRTFAMGKATKEQKDLYKLLWEAKCKAVEAVRPGMNAKLLDAVARDMIKEAGFGDYFLHSLGHGIGLITHEKPIITFRLEDQIIPEDCVLAIEPGVYLPNKFGMRVEDDILVTRSGGEYLTHAPEELPII